ncbi:adenylosuccinate synthetase [Sinomicrobium sp. M5D2P9]
MQTCSVVIDLGFGDAGKGLTTDYLAGRNPESTLVIRFSGGHQVGHTVTRGNFRHTFSNFGSGTLRGVPALYTEHTTLFPPAIALEYQALKAYRPRLFFHPLAMVTTPYDIAYNRAVEKEKQHGSCGLGFGATIARNKEEVYFFANDLLFPWVVKQRLQSIRRYYETLLGKQDNTPLKALYREELNAYDEAGFIAYCDLIRPLYTIALPQELLPKYAHLVFEGSQGILLDTKHGMHPHTTWSRTTSENALQLLRSMEGDIPETDIYYVTRCYQTRHGNGPMSSSKKVTLRNCENETNTENEFQGKFRTAALDPELLRYALSCDAISHHGLPVTKNLVVTCLDQLPEFRVEKLTEKLDEKFVQVLGSYGPDSKDLKRLY